MFQQRHLRSSILAGVVVFGALATGALGQPTTGFSYQGQLRDNGAPKSGLFDMRFTLFDAQTGGSAIGSAFIAPAVSVVGGVFSTMVDFGASATPGAPGFFGKGPRFVQVEVSPAGAATYVALSPRQPLGSVPSALSVGPLSTVSTAGAAANISIPSGGGTFLHAGSTVEQTFTPAADGWIADKTSPSGTGIIGLLHAVPGESATVTFNLLDENGTVLATNGGETFTFPGPYGVLYTGFNWTTTTRVLAGRQYRVRVQLPANVSTVVVGNLYSGGSLFVNGVEVPDRDLGIIISMNQAGQILRTDSPLGIGTNPVAPLHVVGDTILEGNLGLGTTTPQMRLDVNGSSNLNGNVRIASGAVDARLNVAGDGTLGAFDGGGTALLRIRAAGAAQSVRSAYLGYDSTQTAVLTLANQFGVGDINIRPAIGGRVGIGPGVGTTPNAGLEVTNDVAQATITARGSNTWGTWMNLLGPSRNFAIVNGGSLGQVWAGTLGIRDLTTGANRFTIGTNGNITIGNEFPSSSALFNVNANGATEMTIGSNNTFSGNGTALSLRTTGQQAGECQIQGVSRAGFEYGTLVLNPQGGTVAKPGGGSFANYSDRTLKQDIAPLTGTLDRLLSLHGYSFRYTEEAISKKHALKGTQLGLMAQEVQRVFPDWVDTDNEGKLMVTERATTALMVEALRDLREEKDAQIDAQKKEIESLRARLEAIEKALQSR